MVKNISLFFWCTGTIISKFYILTASACLIYKTQNNTWDLIDPKQYIVVIPAEALEDSVREIDVIMVHPNITDAPKYNAGLIGIWPNLEFDAAVAFLPLWAEDANLLHTQLDYVLQAISTFRCFIVAWPNSPDYRPHNGRAGSPPYKVHWVSSMEVRPHHASDCSELICGRTNSSTCQDRLNGTMCLTIVSPNNSYICDADRGAGLSCSQFLWGVLVGGASCTNSDPMPITIRIDSVADFILETYNKPFRLPENKSSVAETALRQSLLIVIIYIIFKIIGAITH